MNLNDAFHFAQAKHAGAVKSGTQVPYLYHPLAVASLVLKYGGSPEQAQAALLHDTIADGEVTHSELLERFGPDVARLTFAFADPPLAGDADWQTRRKAYVEKLGAVDRDALLVVACEELHELEEVLHALRYEGIAVWERMGVPGMNVAWYFRELLRIFVGKLHGEKEKALVSELARNLRKLQGIVFEGEAA